MTSFRARLPQLGGGLFLTDGGIETVLIFDRGLSLPHFAAYALLETPGGRAALKAYYRDYLTIAAEKGTGFILESPTWRCSPDWGAKLGHDLAAIAAFNADAIALMAELRQEVRLPKPVVISGCVGPRGDGYAPDRQLSPAEAEAYHRRQIESFAASPADMVTAVTMTHSGEAIGVVRAARRANIPVAISFTTETDGRLPSDETLGEAIETVDRATSGAPVYFMVNCAHPDHFSGALDKGDWRSRIRGIRANASRKSHAELDNSETLDPGDPHELAQDYLRLRSLLPGLAVVGGCCGTNHRHIDEIGRALSTPA